MENKPLLSTGKIVGLVVLGLLIVMALWFMSSYNSLVRLNENVKTAQAGVEVQYQRRFDLIPNLVKTAEGFAIQERTVFKDLADARSRYAGATGGSSEKVAAINQFESAISRLLVVVENYPQLKSSENFLRLQDEIAGTENRIQVARNEYNDSVNQLNQKINFFPSNVVAGMFNFTERERFTVTQVEAVNPPQIEFDFK